MEKRKGQNSILFVATLGVYLGLVLAGATPQAVAQQRAAMTRNFDISDEIEFKDDLDDTPDKGLAVDKFTDALIDLYRVMSDAAKKDPDAVDKGRFDFTQFLTVFPNGGSRSVFPGELNSSGPHIHLGRSSAPIVGIYDAFLSRPKEADKNCKLDLKLTQTDFTLGVSVTKSSTEIAGYFSAFYRDSVASKKQVSTSTLRSLVYDGTEISANGNQITIVTHLPRASIDDLLATNAK